MSNNSRLQSAIKYTIFTEKAAKLQSEKGVLTFVVDKRTNKVELAQAVEAVLGVKVKSINILNVKGKTKYRGNRKGRRSDFKKAYITLPADANLNQIESAIE
ncbi:50S ribosomal protein L23 [Psittacicella melopsittaci]|uniref:Large ribosomal subunit protein uL23 n=1 Tax=Psittacicella melopsittaci TaxID=2028576 RepID=A0A3A1Y3P3_9GAMM|nr:50S ribosomal protein L23 [Psittacicella melopsittaci]RIY32185.1 50S ribosomal protein L23 [Psittacicella melopsittaci]